MAHTLTVDSPASGPATRSRTLRLDSDAVRQARTELADLRVRTAPRNEPQRTSALQPYLPYYGAAARDKHDATL